MTTGEETSEGGREEPTGPYSSPKGRSGANSSTSKRRRSELDNRLLAAVFGDRVGLAIFLGSLCFFTLFWRASVFITDNYTLVATFEAISNGHLWIEPVDGGSAFDAPGAEVVDGYVYGRNYGQLFLSLPFLWLVQGLARVADLTVALVGIWHLLGLALLLQLGHIYDVRRVAAIGGSALVLCSFIATLVLTTQLFETPIYLLGLQTASLVAASLVGVVMYRIVARLHRIRLGVLAGIGAGFALPIGFWATIPKRHVFTTLLCLAVLYAFLRSREGTDSRRLPVLGPVPVFRAMAYALVGVLTWIHAAEALFVFVPLVVVDVFTAPSNDRRTLALVGAAFLVSLLPFFLTNFAITGQIHTPPRTLSGSGVLGSGSGGASARSGDSTGFFGVLADLPVLGEAVWVLDTTVSFVGDGVIALTNVPELSRTFVKSGSFADLGGRAEFRGINLAVLEAAPVLGGIVAAVVSLGTVARRTGSPMDSLRTSTGSLTATGVLACSFVVAFVLLFVAKLPLHVQITGRYLLPIYPLLLYLVIRLSPVRQILTANYRALAWSYGTGVLIGGQLFLATVVLLDLAVGEAGQLHAYFGVGLAGAVAVTVLIAGFDDRFRPLAAVALGLAAAAGTVFVVLAGLAYFGTVGEHVLPWSRLLDDLIAIR